MSNNLSEINNLKQSSIVNTNLGSDACNKKDYEKALFYWKEAVKNLEDLRLEITKESDDKGKILGNINFVIDDLNKKRVLILKGLGNEQCKKVNYAAAIGYYEEALKINPQNAVIYNAIGYTYRKIGAKHQNLDKQIEYLEKAVNLDPDYKKAIRNLTVVYPLAGRYQDAVECFHKLFELGAMADDYFDYACFKIQLKDFEEGWKYYEYRFMKESNTTIYPKINKPRWEGQKIPDKTLLVHYEQGFGDSLQFFRYLEQVKPYVKKIIFRVQNELVDLIKINAKDVQVVGRSTPLNELSFDYYISLMSLPLILKASVDNIPLSQGYIKADNGKTKEYKNKFFDNNCFKIGISWTGAIRGNYLRNIPPEVFYPLTKLKNTKIYSFQKTPSLEQLGPLPPDVEIVDLGCTFNDFNDTAAAMANVDLFVTSDNGLFNLAGVMGKKTFVLLNKNAEWRWFFDDETTPWYDSVKIFKKQNENDSWGSLLQRVVENIQEN
jgi:tetratricopeptide (TPR) repeat protein